MKSKNNVRLFNTFLLSEIQGTVGNRRHIYRPRACNYNAKDMQLTHRTQRKIFKPDITEVETYLPKKAIKNVWYLDRHTATQAKKKQPLDRSPTR